MPASRYQPSYEVPQLSDPSEEHAIPPAPAAAAAEEILDDELDPSADPGAAVRRRLLQRLPGLTGTQRDYDIALLLVEEQVRRERPDWTAAAIADEADRRFTEMCSIRHPHLPRAFARLMQRSVTPSRRTVRENIEVAACRRIPELREIEATLAGAPTGRPTRRRLPIAVFERCALANLRPELRLNLRDFEGSDAELDWAYLDTPDRETNLRHMRDESNVRKTLKAMLERHDPAVLQKANLQILQRISARHPDGDGLHEVGRNLVIDATPIHAHLELQYPVNAEHAEMLLRGSSATVGRHGGRNRKKKVWVGWKLLCITELVTGLPVIWKLIPSQDPEYTHVLPLLDELQALAPWMTPEYLIGDSEYDRKTQLAFDLQARRDIIPVFPLRERIGREWDWGDTHGVPHCRTHGPMKLRQSENFEAVPDLLAVTGDHDSVRRAYDARIRWRCEACHALGIPKTTTTYPRVNARLYTYLPRGGDHKRHAERIARMLRRNSIEACFSVLKRRGLGGRDHHKARWTSERCHVEWLLGLGLLGMTLRREAHEAGHYDRCAAEAWELRLTKRRPAAPKVERWRPQTGD